ncbi:MAG: hypothetical protein ISEC1_P1837 [Thiomicrorhabdus sp.]|nr:MAG: hypothetical protein ISEC1_P1837 [Thiomicrorhabdus sp.]
MNKTFQFKKLLVSLAIASSAAMTVAPIMAQAGVTANAGMLSNYVFRGVEQAESTSAFTGLDVEADSGLYVGTWIADVEKGLEYDIYAGWAGDLNGVSLGLGGTYYGYTEAAFDSPYKELNLSLGFGAVSVGYDKGIHELATEEDYSNAYISAERGNFTATYGVYDANVDLDNNAVSYLDVGYSTELSAGLDGTVNYIYSMPENSATNPSAYLVLGISKSFDIK